MKPRRWMKFIVNEAKREQVEMPWTRAQRAARRVEKPRLQKAAG